MRCVILRYTCCILTISSPSPSRSFSTFYMHFLHSLANSHTTTFHAFFPLSFLLYSTLPIYILHSTLYSFSTTNTHPHTHAHTHTHRMYGALTGLSKQMVAQRHGPETLKKWRRGYAARPPPISSFSSMYPGAVTLQ